MRIGDKITNPGELRSLIYLQNSTISKDAGSAQKPIWTTRAPVYARWINAHGSEAVASESLQATNLATVLIRYYPGLNTSWAILKGSERWQIVSVDDVRERHEYMELQVRLVKGSV